MKIFNYYILITLSILLSNNTWAQVAHYEDNYLLQAPEEIITKAEAAAQLMQFNNMYEVVIPKKAAMAINPWNKFIAGGINPQTKNPILIINPSWFLSLSEDQQLFLLGRNFSMFKHGITPKSINVIPFIFLAISILLITLIFIALGKTKLAAYHKGIRFFIVLALVALNNAFLIKPLTNHLLCYSATKHDHNINNMTLELTGNKEAAIKALVALDTSIKDELKNGEIFWAPHQNLFANYAQNLQGKTGVSYIS